MTVQKLKKAFGPAAGGFTLIELLIVIAILGVLAVVVLVAINPVQQLARTRDAGRESGVTQMGHAVEAYAVSHNGTYPTEAAAWAQDLVDAGEMSIIPAGIAYTAGSSSACTNQVVGTPGTWCYDNDVANDNGVIVYASLESDSKQSLCANATDTAYFVYATLDGRGGVVCRTGAQGAPVAGTQTYAN